MDPVAETTASNMARNQLSEDVAKYVGSFMLCFAWSNSSRLFNTDKFSDLVVECAGERWLLHRNIICSRSLFFANACKENTFQAWHLDTIRSSFETNTTGTLQEGNSRQVTLYEEDPVIIKQMLTACYTCTYDDSMDGVDNRMEFNVRMHVAADKYMVPFLKDLAKTKSAFQLYQFISGTIDISELTGIIRMMYEVTVDQTLRVILFPVLRRLRHSLRKDQEFMALFTSGLADGKFATDVFTALADHLNPISYYCKSCCPDYTFATTMTCDECDVDICHVEEAR